MAGCNRDNPCLCGGCEARLREIEKRLTEMERGPLATRQPPGERDVSPPTNDYLDNPTDCSCPASTPPAPQRFWRVKEHPGWHSVEQFYDEQGRLHTKAISLGLRKTRADAEADGRASGLPEWKP
jgi:hypothetical protein